MGDRVSVKSIMDEMAATLESSLSPNVGQIVGRLNVNPSSSDVSIDIYPADPSGTDDEAGFQRLVGAYHFIVRARVASPDNIEAQDVLLDLMDVDSDLSVATILEDDQTLNGNASSVDVRGPTGYRRYVDVNAGPSLLGIQWDARVIPVTS